MVGNSEWVDHMDCHAPDLHVAAAVQIQRGIVRIGSFQAKSALMASETLEGEASIEDSHHHSARPGVETAIHHQQITILDAGSSHGMSAHPQEERAGGMADQLFIQINPHLDVVVGGRGKACGHPFAGQGETQESPPRPQGLRVLLGTRHLTIACSTYVL